MSLIEALKAAMLLRYGTDLLARTDRAVLESAIDVLEQAPIICDRAHSGTRCCGPVHMRTCADCGVSFARCEQHGERKGVSREMWLHRERQHPRSNP